MTGLPPRKCSRTEEQLQLILDSTAEAIYGIDRAGNCTFCNNSFLRLMGYQTVDELLGMNVHLMLHHSRADGSKYPLENARLTRRYSREQARMLRLKSMAR